MGKRSAIEQEGAGYPLGRRANPQSGPGKASVEQVFTNIYRNNAWGGRESVSGPGSDPDQTSVVIRELPEVFRYVGARTVLDIPCGDFHWMQHVDLTGIDYVGSDIVEVLILENKKKYENDSIRFTKLDLLKDPLPRVDLVICRDCLVHLSFEHALKALRNICDSKSTHVLTTTYTNRQQNADILTGQWRPLSLVIPPFSLPLPLGVINEDCSEFGGTCQDKALGLWRVTDVEAGISEQLG